MSVFMQAHVSLVCCIYNHCNNALHVHIYILSGGPEHYGSVNVQVVAYYLFMRFSAHVKACASCYIMLY